MIVSDTHRKLANLAQALTDEGKIDVFIHLGDFEGEEDIIMQMAGCEEIYMVPGNNDFFSPMQKELEIKLGKYNVLLTHGHYYYVSLDLATIKSEAVARGKDIVMFGHTHRPVIDVSDDVTLINPGSISYPRQADKKCTYIIMKINDDETLEFELKSV